VIYLQHTSKQKSGIKSYNILFGEFQMATLQ
jgi:hypothetical protein